jgi:putative ABC transport system permease protein
MKTLDRKLIRNLWHMRGQALAIAVVMACGIATYIMSVGTLYSLRETRDLYYDRYRFADIFVSLKRAPLAVADRIAALPGVGAVYPRVAFAATLDMPGLDEPALGQIVSVPDHGTPVLNDIYLRQGRLLQPREADAVLVSESFANAHNLKLGDRIAMVINGHKRHLRMVGVALSPEFVFAIGPGSLMPDNKRFGIFWMSRHALEAAVNMDGAFNNLSLSTTRGANEAAIMTAVDRLLAPYGGLSAITRKDQISNWFLNGELDQLRTMAIVSPLVFLSVAAFLTHIVLMRLIATEREEIGTLKALGYGNRAIAFHYLKLVGAIAAVAAVLGSLAGYWLGQSITKLYTEFYQFPVLAYEIVPSVFLQGALFCFLAAYSGTLVTVLKAARLPPAVAMRPAAPPAYKATLLERFKLEKWFTQPARIILRQIERRPVRFAFSIAGVGMALAIFVASAFMVDALDYILEVQYDITERQDALITFVETRGRRALDEVRSLPGVIHAEPGRSVAVRLSAGPRSYRTAITGIAPGADLRRVIDDRLQPIEPPPHGILLGRKLAEILDVKPGDMVYAEVLEDRRPARSLPVTGVAEGFIGTQAYMSMTALHQLMMEGDTLSSVAVSLDFMEAKRFFRRLKNSPMVAGVLRADTARQAFDETMAENMRTMTLFNIAFSGLIAFGVVYNTVRIAFSERARELASLRVIGMTRGEVGYILLGEVAVVVLLALPIGCLMGYGLVLTWTPLLDTELYRIPIVIAPSTYGSAMVVVLVATFISSWVIWRRIRHLDLVRVLKTRD